MRVKAGAAWPATTGCVRCSRICHSTDFLRVRIGVGKPPSAAQGASHVLRRPPKAVRELLGDLGADGGRRGRAHRGGRRRRRHAVVPLAADLIEPTSPTRPIRRRHADATGASSRQRRRRPRRQPGRRAARSCAPTRSWPSSSARPMRTVAVPEAAQAVLAAALAALHRAQRRSSWSPPPGSTPSGWATTWPASSPRARRGRRARSGRRWSGRWRARSRSCRPGRRCPSSGSAPRPRRWAAAWPLLHALPAPSTTRCFRRRPG